MYLYRLYRGGQFKEPATVNRINRGGRFIPPTAVNNDFLRRTSNVARRGKPFFPQRAPRWPASLAGHRLTVAGKRGAHHGAHFGHAAQIDSCSSVILFALQYVDVIATLLQMVANT